MDEKIRLECEHGPVAFGVSSSMQVVPWKGAGTQSLLYSRLWDALYLYPSDSIRDEQLAGHPVPLMPSIRFATAAAVADWNKDGQDDMIAANRVGFLHYLERRGSYPDLSFEQAGLILDEDSGLPFNIPYDNPHHPMMDNLNGYIESPFFNYPLPLVYPSGDPGVVDLIIGDLAGNLWWMPDSGDGSGAARYRGVRYTKPADQIVSKHGKQFVEQFGYDYARPPSKITDEHGREFLLGTGYEQGQEWPGGNTRPALYWNKATGEYDLLVLSGMMDQKLYYLKKIGIGNDRKPIFQNKGVVDVGAFFTPWNIFYFHSQIAVYEEDGWNQLLISRKHHIVKFRNRQTAADIPEFEFDHFISCDRAGTAGNHFTAILRDETTGKRYLLDNALENVFEAREIAVESGRAMLSAERILLQDQHGVFRVEGETDAQGGSQYYGFNRAVVWDFDRSGKQHLIIGTDKGLLYLLVDEGSAAGGQFRYRSVGPLCDEDGQVIKVHNRCCPCAIDLDGDGKEDLIVGGVSYQLGIRNDPHPGGDILYFIHGGLDANGLPVLRQGGPLPVDGFAFRLELNHHVSIQAADIDRDGHPEVLISCNQDGFTGNVFKADTGRIGVTYTGRTVGRLGLEESLLDIDGDGQLEVVFGGGEEGVAYYRKTSG